MTLIANIAPIFAHSAALVAALWPLDRRLGGLLFVAMLASGAASVWLSASSRRAARAAAALAPNAPSVRTRRATDLPLEDILIGFETWLAGLPRGGGRMSAFDAFVRELLGRDAQATHVRCYRYDAARQRLTPLSAAHSSAESARADECFKSLAATGEMIATPDSVLGASAVKPENEADRAPWAWVVRDGETPIGFVSVGRFSAAPPPTQRLRALASLVNLLWRQARLLDEVDLLSRTDKKTGALTRTEFFTVAQGMLDRAGDADKSFVAAVLTLEGLRGLDDAGRWRERDEILSEVGGRLQSCLRPHDLLGRFADDRYVILLRNADVTLARVITGKIVETLGRVRDAEGNELVVARVGLTAATAPPFDLTALLRAAFAAARDARLDHTTIATREPKGGGA